MTRRTRQSNRSRRNNGSTDMKRLLSTLAVVAVILCGAGFAISKAGSGPQQSDNYCWDTQGAYQKQELIYIDNSPSPYLTPRQKRDVLTLIQERWDAAEPNTQFAIFSSGNLTGGSVAKPALSICKPSRTPEEQRTIGAPVKTTVMLRRELEDASKRFKHELTTLMEATLSADAAAGDSPILEQIRSLTFYPGFRGELSPITIVTDGIQNSELARFCVVKGDLPSFEVFAKRPAYQAYAPKNFDGAQVTFALWEWGALPGEFCTAEEIQAFWKEYAEGNGSAKPALVRHMRAWAGE